jgi:hypothetical protein
MSAKPDRPEPIERPHFSDWAAVRGSLAAVVVSYILSITLMLVSTEIYTSALLGEWPDFGAAFLYFGPILLGGFIGLPIVIAVTLLSMIFWSLANERGQTSYAAAIRVGLKTAAVVVAVELAGYLLFFLARGVAVPPASGNPYSDVNPLWAWLKFLADAICTLGIGALTGIAVRAAAGPPTLPGKPDPRA